MQIDTDIFGLSSPFVFVKFDFSLNIPVIWHISL